MNPMTFQKTDPLAEEQLGFSPRALDFIVDYGIKYRLGRDTESEED